MLDLPAKSNGETIKEHTEKLLESFSRFKEIYGEYFTETQLKAIQYACEYHDYGKASYSFQKQIKNKNFIDDKNLLESIQNMYSEIGLSEKILPHGYVSPAFIDTIQLKRSLDNDINMLKNVITAIYYHHNRKIKIDNDGLKRIIKEDLLARYPEKKISAGFKTKVMDREFFEKEENWINYALIVGMLNKFDYYASCEDYNKYEIEIKGCDKNGKYICDKITDYFNENNYGYRDVQKYALEHTDENIVIIASTGIGKTESAFLWAGKSKLFYTLPLKVSINAMYERIINKYKYPAEKTALLHSDAFSYISEENDEDDTRKLKLKYDASRRFSYPLTVCTIDQLFTFVYKYKGCEQIFAVLKYSKLVIDEIQSYEPLIIAKIIYGLKLISLAGGKFAIITATFPPVFEYFMKKNNIPCCKPEKFLIQDKIRHKIHYCKEDDFDYDFITEKSKDKKVLVICNTVKRAFDVYKKLKERTDNVRVIHSNFIRKHRRELEKAILDFNGNGIWVSTQIVEASLDIDFDVLFTEMSTADSLLQRMGRCYRNRDYKSDEPNVYILDNHNGYGKVYKYKDIYDRSAEFLTEYQDTFFTEDSKMKYINRVYDTESIKSSEYFRDIEDEIKQCENIMPFLFEKNDAKSKFRNITSYTVVPKSIYNENTEEFHRCIDILTEPSKKNLTDDEKAENFLIKQNARKFIEDNSIQISNFDPRARNKSSSLFKGLEYYTVDYQYKYNENDIYDDNVGLTYDFDIEDNFF